MPWNGAGTYSPPAASFPEVNGTIIDATRFNPTITDLAAGITNAIAKDGQNIPTANLPMGGLKHTGAGDATAAGQYLVYGQAAAGSFASLGLGAGSVGSPSLFPNGDTNTGMWFPGADAIAWSVGGVEVIRVNSTGGGLGTIPSSRWHVKGTGAIMRAETTTARGSGQCYYYFTDPTGEKGLVGFAGTVTDVLSVHNTLNDEIRFGTNNVARWAVSSAGDLYPIANNVYTVGAAANRLTNLYSTLGNFSGTVTIGGSMNSGPITGTTISGTIGTFTSNVAISGSMAAGAITGTTGVFSGTLTGVAASFSSSVTMAALNATTGTFSGAITADGGFNTALFAVSTYTPTLTNVTNVASSTVVGLFQYVRMGAMVIGVGHVTIDPTAAGATTLAFTLPVASNFATQQDGMGVGSNQTAAGQAGGISADTGNDRLDLTFNASDTANQTWKVIFFYRII